MSLKNSINRIPNLRRMNWIEIIDRVFHLYRVAFKLFIGIAVVYFITDFLQDWVTGFLPKNYAYRQIRGIFNYLFSEVAAAAIVIVTTEVYFQRPIRIRDTFQRLVKIHPRYIVSLFIFLIPLFFPALVQPIIVSIPYLSAVITLFLLLLSYVVFIYFFITWGLYLPVIIVEGCLKPKPLRRSRDLMRKSRLRVFFTFFSLWMLMEIVRTIFVASFVILIGMLGFLGDYSLSEIVKFVLSITHSLFKNEISSDSVSPIYQIIKSFHFVIRVFIYPLFAIMVTVIYFNQRVKLEEFDR